MTRPSAVLFDCDGVLADTEGTVNRLVAEDLSLRGWPMDGVEARETFLGLALPDMVPLIEARCGPLPRGWGRMLSARIATRLSVGVDAMPGAVAAVMVVHAAGIPVACASNSSRIELAIKLPALGLHEVFLDRAFSFEDVARPKPWPDLWIAAARACGAAPRDCVVVEDSLAGVRSARAAGCRVLGLAHPGEGDGLAAAGAQVFRAMAELPGLLGLQEAW
ncbi:HAD superfamily hydrolase (TIGR01509 family) [Humitalea rosea]|uniref:HAD superfamily hydrolase (TIGR01509 family) n=1 Tax=Humitalea rosea TaxID=990373 RepID=A0A2W7IT10_9PROT|nr:HAD family phosphatase [Humitalea rosea]PZW50389.1 HAD superfamily hydrolase (TIGR01509 family) [Humitalea rosea]